MILKEEEYKKIFEISFTGYKDKHCKIGDIFQIFTCHFRG